MPFTRADIRLTSTRLLQHKNHNEHPFSPQRWQTVRPARVGDDLFVAIGSETVHRIYPAQLLLDIVSDSRVMFDSDPLPEQEQVDLPVALTRFAGDRSANDAYALMIRVMLGYPLPEEDAQIDALATRIKEAGITLHPPGKLLELRTPEPLPVEASYHEVSDYVAQKVRDLDDISVPVAQFGPAPIDLAAVPFMEVQTLTNDEFKQFDQQLIFEDKKRQSWPFKTMTVGQLVRIPPELAEKAIHAAHSYGQSTGYKRFSVRRDPQPAPDQTPSSAPPVPTSVTIVRLTDRPNIEKRNINSRKGLTR